MKKNDFHKPAALVCNKYIFKIEYKMSSWASPERRTKNEIEKIDR